MRFGKLPAKEDPRTLRLEKYLLPDELPKVPAAVDWSDGLPWDDDPLGNDNVGDCAVAAPGHAITLASRLNGVPSPVTTAGILADYSAITGYDPADPGTDQGAYLLDVMKYWRNVGICGVKIEAFVSVLPEHIDAAVALFGGVIVGFSLPVDIWDQDIWRNTELPGRNGHAIFQLATSPGLDVGDTWGWRRPWTVPFRNKYQDERYAFLMRDRPVPSGLDLDRLRADLNLL